MRIIIGQIFSKTDKPDNLFVMYLCYVRPFFDELMFSGSLKSDAKTKQVTSPPSRCCAYLGDN